MNDTENNGQIEKEEKGIPFFPNHVLKEVIVAFIVFGGLITLATYYPAPMEPPADPFVTPEHIKPEWYFLAAYQFLKVAEYLDFLGQWAPKALGIMGQGVVFALLMFWPFIDKNPERHPKRRPFAVVLGIVGIISFTALTVWGYLS